MFLFFSETAKSKVDLFSPSNMSSEADIFRHVPLTDTRQQIRLLRFVGDYDDLGAHELKCELFVCNREAAPVYHVISHVAGGGGSGSNDDDLGSVTTSISINGRRVQIPLSCENAFRKGLRSLGGGGAADAYYWMNELCINRKDELETQHQVARLTQVYRDATRVLQVRGGMTEAAAAARAPPPPVEEPLLLTNGELKTWMRDVWCLEDEVSDLLESAWDRLDSYDDSQLARLTRVRDIFRHFRLRYSSRVRSQQHESLWDQRLSEYCEFNHVPMDSSDGPHTTTTGGTRIQPRHSHQPHGSRPCQFCGCPTLWTCNASGHDGHDTQPLDVLSPVVSASGTQPTHTRDETPPRRQPTQSWKTMLQLGLLRFLHRQDEGRESPLSSSDAVENGVFDSRWQLALGLMRFPKPEIDNAASWYARCGLQLATRVAGTLQLMADAGEARIEVKARRMARPILLPAMAPLMESLPSHPTLKDRQWAGIRITDGSHSLYPAMESDCEFATDLNWSSQFPPVDVRGMNTFYLDEAKSLPFAHLPSKAEYGDWVIWSTGGRELEALQDIVLLLRTRPTEGRGSPKHLYDIIGQGRKIPRLGGFFGVSLMRAHFQLNFHPEDALALAVQVLSEYNSIDHHTRITSLLERINTRVCGYERTSYAERVSDQLLCSII